MANKSSSEVVPSNSKTSKIWFHTLAAKITVGLTTAITLTAVSVRMVLTFNINLLPQNSAAANSQRASQSQQDFPDCYSLSPNNDKACRSYNDGLKALKSGDKVHGYMQIGQGYNDMGNPTKGLEYYRIAKNLPHSPEDEPALINGEAWSLNLLHQPDKALKLADESIALNPYFPHAWATKANAESRLGKQREACISAKKASHFPEVQLEPSIKSSCGIQ
jgi:tetratricopeptide (TPR) repeat protein